MILADTSVWVDHLRKGDAHLADLLNYGEVVCHPFVVGEVAMGILQERQAILTTLRNLPRAVAASEDEVLHVIETRSLAGTGIGYVDAHLLAAVLLSPGIQLWTRDKRLRSVAERLELHVAYA